MGDSRAESMRWTREEALDLARSIRNELPDTLHLGLTGSLILEDSGNDLDIIVYPHNVVTMSVQSAIDAMRRF